LIILGGFKSFKNATSNINDESLENVRVSNKYNGNHHFNDNLEGMGYYYVIESKIF